MIYSKIFFFSKMSKKGLHPPNLGLRDELYLFNALHQTKYFKLTIKYS
jgi:hypothetical protein